jgi:hypothetical protein
MRDIDWGVSLTGDLTNPFSAPSKKHRDSSGLWGTFMASNQPLTPGLHVERQ